MTLTRTGIMQVGWWLPCCVASNLGGTGYQAPLETPNNQPDTVGRVSHFTRCHFHRAQYMVPILWHLVINPINFWLSESVVGKSPNWTSPNYGVQFFSNGYLKVMFKIPKTGHLPTLWIQYVDLQTTFTTKDHRDPSSKLTDWSQWLDCSKPQLAWWYIYPVIFPLLLGCSHCIPIIIKERYMIYANRLLIRIIRHMRHILHSNCIYIKYYWFFPLGTLWFFGGY